VQASFEGQMERVETPDLLTFVNQARRTGLLELERDGQSTRIYFLRGDPIFATSTRAGIRLGDLLLRLGKVSQRDLDRCAARPRAAGDRMGQILVSEGLLTDSDLRSILKVQISEVIFDSFSWGEGRFSFYDDVVHPPDVITIDMNLQNLIMEGVRRLDERGRLAEAFPDLDVLVESLANPEWVKTNMSLTPEEWSVFFLVDGRRSLKEICELAGHADDLTALEILNRLRGTKLIGLVEGKKTEDSSESVSDTNFRTTPTKAPSDRQPAPPPVVSEIPAPAPPPAPKEDDSLSIVSRDAIHYAASGTSSARLVLEDASPKVTYPLHRDAYTLGRGPKNDIVVGDINVSTFHVRLERAATGFRVYDLKSTNGTAINMKRVIEPTVLKPNDVLNLGPVRLRYLED